MAATGAVAQTPAVPRFVEETDASGFQSRFEGEGEFLVGGGVATFDCDADGMPEVYVTAGVNRSKFYRNKSTRGGPIKLLEERSGLELTNANGAYPLDIDGDSPFVADVPDGEDLIEAAGRSGYVQWLFRPVRGGIWSEVADDITLQPGGYRNPPCPLLCEAPERRLTPRDRRWVYQFGRSDKVIDHNH